MSLIINIIMGLLVGFLINYLADVLPSTHNIIQPTCEECHQPFPIKDYFFSMKCPHCSHRKSLRSIIVLVSMVVVCILLHYFPFHNLGFWATLPILTYLGLVAVIDIEHHLVLGETTLFGIVLFLIYGVVLHGWTQTLIGALAGFLIMLVFYFLGMAFSKIVGKLRHREISEVAFGFGDVTTSGILGLFAGWPVIIGSIILGFITFTVYSVIFLSILILTKKYKAFANALPFTPFLILGMIILYYL